MQKFWKSVKIWQSYREFQGGPFFWDTVYICASHRRSTGKCRCTSQGCAGARHRDVQVNVTGMCRCTSQGCAGARHRDVQVHVTVMCRCTSQGCAGARHRDVQVYITGMCRCTSLRQSNKQIRSICAFQMLLLGAVCIKMQHAISTRKQHENFLGAQATASSSP